MSDSNQLTPEIDAGDYRRVLGHFPTGVTVVTASGADRNVGIAIGSFASISLDPPLVGFFLGSQSSSLDPLEESGHFCVNILGADQTELCGTMASRSDDKFDGVDFSPAPGSGAPLLGGVHAYIDCRVENIVPAGDHVLVIGRVLALDTVDDDLDPMVFYKGQYGTFKG